MNYRIPLFDLNFDIEEEKAVCETLRSKWISIGPKTLEFETKFAESLGIKHAVALSNCTVALHLAMRILEIGAGDEVICPSLTFVATVNAIRYVQAEPVFCDIISYHNLTIDPEEIIKLITKKTKAIIVVHYGGFPCEMDKILDIARIHHLKVIEDNSHGPLSEYKGRKLGTMGDIGCFSFFANKNISIGEGGMLVTNRDEYREKANLLRSHGMTSLSYDRAKGHSTSYDVVELGYNYRIDDLRSAIGLVQLRKLKNDLDKRRELRKLYIKYLSPIRNIYIPFQEHDEFCSNYIFPIVLENSDSDKRNMIRNNLHSHGIQTSIHYPAVHLFNLYHSKSLKLENTEYVSDNEITLPMYSKLTDEEVNYIAQTLQSTVS